MPGKKHKRCIFRSARLKMTVPDCTKIRPAMTAAEMEILDKHILFATQMLEFGMGGSTMRALVLNSKLKITSIETSQSYITLLKTNSIIKAAIANGRLCIRQIDIGPVKEWGYPTKCGTNLKNYTIGLWPQLSEEYDLILIDGRFRLATALCALLFYPKAVFLFHDFINRPSYHHLLSFVDVITVRDTLIVYKCREKHDIREALKLIFTNLEKPL